MTEYELHTLGARHCHAPAYDGRDPMRNRPLLNGTSMTIKRYGLGREYAGNTGSPAITEQADGPYVRYDDHAAMIGEFQAEKAGLESIVAAQAGVIAKNGRLLIACEAHNEMLIGRLKLAEGAPAAAQEPAASRDDQRAAFESWYAEYIANGIDNNDGLFEPDVVDVARATWLAAIKHGRQPPASAPVGTLIDEGAKAAQPSVPEGFRLIAVNSSFDVLMFWMDLCEAKGHLENCPDLVEPWEAFEYRELPTPPANEQAQQNDDEPCEHSEHVRPLDGVCVECGDMVGQQDAEKVDALCDSNYLAGAKEGWNLAASGDSEGFQRLFESRRGYLKPIRDAQPDPAMAGDDLDNDDIRNAFANGCGYSDWRGLDYVSLGSQMFINGCRALLKRVQPASATVSDELLRFLHGSGEIDNVAFGERHPNHRGRFWWRTLLPQPGEVHPASGEDVRDAARYRAIRSISCTKQAEAYWRLHALTLTFADPASPTPQEFDSMGDLAMQQGGQS